MMKANRHAAHLGRRSQRKNISKRTAGRVIRHREYARDSCVAVYRLAPFAFIFNTSTLVISFKELIHFLFYLRPGLQWCVVEFKHYLRVLCKRFTNVIKLNSV